MIKILDQIGDGRSVGFTFLRSTSHVRDMGCQLNNRHNNPLRTQSPFQSNQETIANNDRSNQSEFGCEMALLDFDRYMLAD